MPDVISGQAAASAPDPVALISAILDAEKVTPDTPKAPAETAQPQEGEAEYKPEENATVEGEDAPKDEGEEKAAVAEIPLDQLEAIELETTYKGQDGKDVTEKLPIKALREGYMRQQDYQRKTAEVARQREEVGEKTRQAIEIERSAYQQELQRLNALVIESVAPELKNVDWNTLATNDPFEYVRLRNRAEQITNTLATIKSKTEELTNKQKAEQGQTLKQVAQKARQTLESDIPGFDDTLYNTLLRSGENIGYKAEEVATWVDPRAIKLLHKAYLYDQMQAQKPAVEKKVVNVPKVVKPGATPTASPTNQRATEAMKRLSKSGSVNDLAAVIANRM